MPEDLSDYFSGKRLYGDDFTLDQIEEWFQDEQEAYANLGAKDQQHYRYVYHQLNIRHGYAHLGTRRFRSVLGFGSAYGEEFMPILGQLDSITILDPSDAFSNVKDIGGVHCEYAKPNLDGRMSFEDGRFDLITSLGAMHHIPNVSRVIKECFRCLSAGGVMLMREPIVSMGDWTRPRARLTRRERGIPLGVFREIIQGAGFTIKRQALCVFPAIVKLADRMGVDAYNSRAVTALDAVLSRAFSWNTRYHRTSLPAKLGPTSVYFVLEKE